MCFPMIVGIGVDVVLVEDFTAAVDGQPGRYAERIFTPHEIAQAKAQSDAYQVLAARLAVKEAFMKAIGTGWSEEVDWLFIEVRNHDTGKPYIELSGTARDLAEKNGVMQMHVSMSHTPLLASAFVILEGAATQVPPGGG
jgi:holo-[acyl-carrier protein] synthase